MWALHPSQAHGINKPTAQIDPVKAHVIQPDLKSILVRISAEQFGHLSLVGCEPSCKRLRGVMFNADCP